MKISQYAVKHPAVIGMILIVLVVFGFYSLSGMNIAFMSDISMPSMIVISIYPGASAEDVEEDVTSILEDDFVTLPNFKTIDSSSENSVSFITITFQDGVDPESQLAEVRHRITQLMDDLPSGLAGTPWAVIGGVTMLPVVLFSIEGGEDIGKITTYIEDKVKPKLTSIPGVSEIEISGGKKIQANIKLRLDDLAAKNISVTKVYQAITYNNTNLPIGSANYDMRTIDMRYEGGFSSIEDIENIAVGVGDKNVIVYLKDVADISFTYPDEEQFVTDGSKPITTVSVKRRSDGNIMTISSAVKKIINEIEAETNGALTCNIISDDSRIIKTSLTTVIRSGLMGILMAIIVIFLFLNDTRATLIIGLSIPLSILFTFIGMSVMGISINLMSLSGMVVALGMVVDGSIVMLEQIFRYYKMKKADGTQLMTVTESIFRGSSEVGASIFASTATTVVVFIPMAMVTGLVGKILKDVSLTLVLALTASVLVAIIVVPFLIKQIVHDGDTKIRKETAFNRGVNKLEKLYRRGLDWALVQWKFILVIAFSVLIITFFIIKTLGLAFIPSTDNSDFYIDLALPKGSTIEQTREKMLQTNNILRENVPEVKNAVFITGKNQSMGSNETVANCGNIRVVLVPVADRNRSVHEIILEMQSKLTSLLPDVEVKVSNGGFDKILGFASGGGGYGITLVSEDMDTLYKTALRLENFLKNDKDVVTTELDTSMDTSTLVIDITHNYLTSLGLTSYEAGLTNAILFQGVDAGRFTNKQDNERYDIRLESTLTGKEVSLDDITNIKLTSLSGKQILLDNVADISTKQSISQINHIDRAKTITVSTTLATEDTSGVSTRMNNYLKDNPLPPGVTNRAGGIMELLGDSIPPLITALLIAWFLVYTVMVLQFERFRQPFIVMAAIPFCLIGVTISMLIFGSTMSLLPFLGIVALGGVVVNNGIILIDYINLLRKEKETEHPDEDKQKILRDSVTEGSASRIRPIFMTTLTTMLGVVPMAVSTGEGAELYAPLGQAIAGGLLTSTLITLFVIPILYYITERQKLNKSTKKLTLSKMIIFLIPFCLMLNQPKTFAQPYSYEQLKDNMLTFNTDIRNAQQEYLQSTYDTKDAKAAYGPTIDLTLACSYISNPLIDEIRINVREITDSLNMTQMLEMSGVDLNQKIKVFDGMSNDQLTAKLNITQPIFTWGKITNSVKLYSNISTVRNLQLKDKISQLDSELRAKLSALFYLTKIKNSVELQKEYSKQLVSFTEDAQTNGTALKQDVLEAKTQAKELDIVSLTIDEQFSNLLVSVRRITGIKDLEYNQIVFSPAETVFFDTAKKTYEELNTLAISPERSSMQIANYSTIAATHAKQIAEADIYWKPDLVFQASGGYSGCIPTEADDFKNNYAADFTIAFKTTAFDGGKKKTAIKRAASKLESAAIQNQEIEDTISQTISEKLNALKVAIAKVEYQELKIQTSELKAEQNKQMQKTGYGSEIDVLKSEIEIEKEKIELQQNWITASTAYFTIGYLCEF